MPSLTRLPTGGVLNPLKNATNTSHNELLHQDPLQPPLEPRLRAEWGTQFTSEKLAAYMRAVQGVVWMGWVGVCWDNAMAKSSWATFKTEYY